MKLEDERFFQSIKVNRFERGLAGAVKNIRSCTLKWSASSFSDKSSIGALVFYLTMFPFLTLCPPLMLTQSLVFERMGSCLPDHALHSSKKYPSLLSKCSNIYKHPRCSEKHMIQLWLVYTVFLRPDV